MGACTKLGMGDIMKDGFAQAGTFTGITNRHVL